MADDNQQQNNQQQQQAPPWHTGIDAETIGFWQNKGYDLTDQKSLALKLTEQYRAAEKHIGAPPDRLIRLPDKPDDAAWGGVFSKLGVPADGKDYDLSNVKFGGNDLDPAFADTMRAALLKGRVPKDAAPEVVKSIVKHLEDTRTQADTVDAGKLAAEKTALKTEWGPNFDFNHLKAMEGARKLGITPEAVKAMEGQIGYKGVMEAMRKIGQGVSEDTFIDNSRGPNGSATTREGAISRKQELMADRDWGKRYLDGGLKEKQEMDGLNTMIDGAA